MPRSTELVILVALCAAAAWMLYAFAQEVYFSKRLSEQAASLRRQNAALQAENAGYRRDIAAVASGAAAEEESRLNGYARSDEKVYVVSAPPAAPPAARAPAKADSRGVGDALDSIGRWVSDHWHG
jgi:cell division protein FtsB